MATFCSNQGCNICCWTPSTSTAFHRWCPSDKNIRQLNFKLPNCQVVKSYVSNHQWQPFTATNKDRATAPAFRPPLHQLPFIVDVLLIRIFNNWTLNCLTAKWSSPTFQIINDDLSQPIERTRLQHLLLHPSSPIAFHRRCPSYKRIQKLNFQFDICHH